MTLSWADKKEVCETWSPSRIAYCDMKMRWFRCSDRNQGELKWNNYSTTNGKTGHEVYTLQHGLLKSSLQLLNLVSKQPWGPILCQENPWYQSHSVYLRNYELCHMNMTLTACSSTLSCLSKQTGYFTTDTRCWDHLLLSYNAKSNSVQSQDNCNIHVSCKFPLKHYTKVNMKGRVEF